ncbi:MAG: hypothetical protein ACREMA_05245 [Longimicrobiales bacterium]
MKCPYIIVALVLAAACGGDRPGDAAPGASSAELDAIVDSVMPRLQSLAGLPLRSEVSIELQSRDSLRKFVETQMDKDFPAEELNGLRTTYVTLGLLPADIDLRKLMLDLLGEQVVGYYDPATKKLFVMEGTPRELLRSTVAHELVHALQDQHANLDSLTARSRGNDRQTAAQAAIEGHATLVMIALAAEEQYGGRFDPRTLPDISQIIRPGIEQNDQLPVFRRAPRILRETLLFPYVAGAGLVHKLWIRPLETGVGDPFPAPVGPRLPQSTEQVMHPESRFMVKRDEPTELGFEGADSARVVRENTLGELETSIWLSEHLGANAARLAQGWDGDRYRLLRTSSEGHALVWYSVWDTEAAADGFADAARRVAQKRGRPSRVERMALNGTPAVLVVDADPGTDLPGLPVPRARLR